MKKLLVVGMFVTGLYACNKPTNQTTEPTTNRVPSNLHLISDTITPIGDKHDSLVMTYINTYGLPDSTSHSYDSVRAIIIRIVTISTNKGYIDPASITDEVDGIMEIMSDVGVLDENHNLKNRAGVQAAIMTTITNSRIYDAIDDINNYGDPATLPTYGDNQLKALSGLTTLEQGMVDNYGGILEGSYQTWGAMWNTLSQLDKVAVFAKADAMGSAIGFHNCVVKGEIIYGPHHVAAVMATTAAYYSILATKQ